MDYGTAFFLGLIGSLHCAGMCGPLALAVPTQGTTAPAVLLNRLGYNLGRLITYGALGVVFGWAGRTLWLAGVQRWLSIALGLVLLAGLLSSHRLSLAQPVIRLVGGLKVRMAGLLRRRSFLAVVGLGLLNGLLPCGLVYVAAAAATAAAAVGGVWAGAGYMLAFGLGTVPMMLAIGLSGRLLPSSLRLRLTKAIPVSVFLLATLLILRGLSLGIPYVSPDLSARESCCQR